MRMRVLLVSLIAISMSCGALMVSSWPGVHAGAAAETIPDAEMIGTGVISTDEDELGGGITPDGQTLIYEKSAAPHYLYIMCESHLIDGKWGAPEILPVSGQYRDTDPVITPDGKAILFASDRPVNGQDLHRWSIWRAERSSGNALAEGWSDPFLQKAGLSSPRTAAVSHSRPFSSNIAL